MPTLGRNAPRQLQSGPAGPTSIRKVAVPPCPPTSYHRFCPWNPRRRGRPGPRPGLRSGRAGRRGRCGRRRAGAQGLHRRRSNRPARGRRDLHLPDHFDRDLDNTFYELHGASPGGGGAVLLTGPVPAGLRAPARNPSASFDADWRRAPPQDNNAGRRTARASAAAGRSSSPAASPSRRADRALSGVFELRLTFLARVAPPFDAVVLSSQRMPRPGCNRCVGWGS